MIFPAIELAVSATLIHREGGKSVKRNMFLSPESETGLDVVNSDLLDHYPLT